MFVSEIQPANWQYMDSILAAQWPYIAAISDLLMKQQCDVFKATLHRVSAASTVPGDDKSNDGNTRSPLTWDEGSEQVKLLQNWSSSKFPDLEFRLQGTFLYDLREHSIVREITRLYGADFSTFQHF